MALTASRTTARKEIGDRYAPLAAAVHIFPGAIACIDANGNLTPGATATTLKLPGIALDEVDNSAGGAGAVGGRYQRGICGYFDNSASTDQIARSDIGNNCYIVDDHTVAKTNGSNTRSVAGRIEDVDPNTGEILVFFA